jgi:hypothetical protein
LDVYANDGLVLGARLEEHDRRLSVAVVDARLWHPWLSINRVLRVMLHQPWSAEAGANDSNTFGLRHTLGYPRYEEPRYYRAAYPVVPTDSATGAEHISRPVEMLTIALRHSTLTVAFLVVAFAGKAVAQSGWFLIAPPTARDKPILLKAVSANSEAELSAIVDGLPSHDQLLFIEKVGKILTVPTQLGRMEALMDAAQDPSAPLREWRQIGAFDSAANCERRRVGVLQLYEREFAKLRSSYNDDGDVTKESMLALNGRAAARKSRCVPESAYFAR